MDKLKVFENKELGKVRAVEHGGEPWFVGKDVAEVLGYANARDALSKHVDEEDKNTVAIRDGIQGNPNQTIINESGLYSLILSSKLPRAKEFKRWVTAEVLPAIRKTGKYAVKEKLCTDIPRNPKIQRQLSRIRKTTTALDALLDAYSLYHESEEEAKGIVCAIENMGWRIGTYGAELKRTPFEMIPMPR